MIRFRILDYKDRLYGPSYDDKSNDTVRAKHGRQLAVLIPNLVGG